ncbi:MAG: hypothetical protein ABSF70_18590 [Terracidiphilus sp.]
MPESGGFYATKSGWLDQASSVPVRALSATELPHTASFNLPGLNSRVGSLQPEIGYHDADGNFQSLNLSAAIPTIEDEEETEMRRRQFAVLLIDLFLESRKGKEKAAAE